MGLRAGKNKGRARRGKNSFPKFFLGKKSGKAKRSVAKDEGRKSWGL